jgi:hypothetical protein
MEEPQRKNGKGLAERVGIEYVVLYVASQNPQAAYYENDALCYGFQIAKQKRPQLECLFDGDEPNLLMKILDARHRIFLKHDGRRYIEFCMKDIYGPEVFDALKPLVDDVWNAADKYRNS